MPIELIAQFDTDKLGDWMEIIIILLVIGGSAFGGITKALIRKFGGGQTDKKRTGPNIPEIRPPSRARPAQPIPSLTPTLQRPQAPKLVGEEGSEKRRERQRPVPMARPVVESLPEVLSELLPELLPIPTPPARQPTAQAPDRADSERTQHERKPKRHRRPQRREPPPRTPAKSLAEKLSGPQGSEQRLGHLTSSLGHLETRVGDHVRSHMGEESEETSGPEGEIDLIHNPTAASLRQAIIMSEVLGPPIALRSADTNLWNA